jgi:hypothetical protein
MSIATYIDDLRGRPDHHRKKAAFWWAFGITAVIFLFWLASFDFSGKAVRSSAAAVASTVSSPGESLVAGVGAFAGDVWHMIVGPKQVKYSEVQVLPGKN